MNKTYKNGFPFSNSLVKNLDKLQQRIDNRKASLIIIDGGVGEGKTTLGIEIGDYINRINSYGEIELTKDGPQLAIGGIEFLRKMRVCYERKLPCIIYDEAGDFSKRGSLTHFNSMLNRTFETFRAFKCLVILVLPSFDILDQRLIDNQIPRMLLHLKDRTLKTGNYYGYSLYRINLLKLEMSKKKIKNFAFSKIKPNIYGHFLDLTKERSLILDKLTTKNKLAILRKSEVRIEGLLSYSEMATKLSRSIDWVRRAAANLKIKPTRSIGRAKFFDDNALNRLADHLDITSSGVRGPSK